jgi:hypothetical protein
MCARASEAIIEVEVAKGGIEVVTPEQACDAPSEPDAFGVSGRAAQCTRSFREIVSTALVLARGIVRLLLLGGFRITALRGNGRDRRRQDHGQSCSCDKPRSENCHAGSLLLAPTASGHLRTGFRRDWGAPAYSRRQAPCQTWRDCPDGVDGILKSIP